ncbi:hypothetical protein [Bradyrhizobium sp.]|uniref:hypothetical protein n=1 Tax=Bradyrhizobium sp. TaxID=376 RepID=UPI002628BA62|nr:hypothetical protein [Bradyrhizobium sp.]
MAEKTASKRANGERQQCHIASAANLKFLSVSTQVRHRNSLGTHWVSIDLGKDDAWAFETGLGSDERIDTGFPRASTERTSFLACLCRAIIYHLFCLVIYLVRKQDSNL